MNRMRKPRVVIVGAGFAGLWAARSLAKEWADVTLVDRNNYHTFLALLYQVASAELEPEDIAYPVRSIFWECPGVAFALAEVTGIDFAKKSVLTDGRPIPYDYLILAAGSVPHTFGIPGTDSHAYNLKTLEEAVLLKNHIICCFEQAARSPDTVRGTGILTFAIAGGGATGVEYAGALSELVHGPLTRDYRTVDFRAVRIVLLEASDRLVAHMPGTVCDYAARRLRKMGVEVRLGAKVAEVTPGGVRLEDGSEIPSRTVVWTAGVRGEPVAGLSGLPTERDGRVPVLPTLQVPGRPEIYAVGDLASIRDREARLPMVAQVAIQSAIAAAGNIVRQIKGDPPQPFAYRDRGMMIAIGRNAAGAAIGSSTYTGFFAWILWLVIHLFNLIGFRNRIMVLVNWAWDYLLYERAVRFVFPKKMAPGPKSAACTTEVPQAGDRPGGENDAGPGPAPFSRWTGQTATGPASCGLTTK